MSDDDVRPGGFEDRLLGELRMVVAERASDAGRPSGRPRGHLARGGRRFALAGAVAVVVVLVGMSGLLRHYGDGSAAGLCGDAEYGRIGDGRGALAARRGRAATRASGRGHSRRGQVRTAW